MHFQTALWLKGPYVIHYDSVHFSATHTYTGYVQIQDRTRQVIKNIEAVLSADEMTLKNVVKATIYIKNFDENFPLVNQVSSRMPM